MKTDDSEPMYDDCNLELIERQETEELISALVGYCKDLEKQVVELRCYVNKLTSLDSREPFPDPQSDLYRVFYHYPAYSKYKRILKQLD